MKELWEKIKQINWLNQRFIMVVAIVVLVYLMMDINNRLTTRFRLTNEEAALQTRIVELQATQIKLRNEIAYATSEVAVEEWAREDMRMINEGDHPIILLPPGDFKPEATPSAAIELIIPEKIDIWKELLFGSSENKP